MADDNLQPLDNPLPDPPKAESGKMDQLMGKAQELFETGKIKAGEAWEKAQENERIKHFTDKTIEVAGRAQEKAMEKYDQASEKAKEKIEQIKENEKVKQVVAKTGEYIEKTKEAGGKTKAKTKAIWGRGKGKVVKIRNELNLTWGENAKEVLLKRAEAAQKWQDIKIKGAEDMTISARSEFTTAYFVEKGTLMRWSFRVKDYDVGFGVRVRVMQDGGSVEEDVLPVERFDNADTIEGSWVADEDRTMVLVFDNTYSKFRSKTVAFLVGTVAPPADGSGHQELEGEESAESKAAQAGEGEEEAES